MVVDVAHDVVHALAVGRVHVLDSAGRRAQPGALHDESHRLEDLAFVVELGVLGVARTRPEPGQQGLHLGEFAVRAERDEGPLDVLELARVLPVQELRRELRRDLDGDALHGDAAVRHALPRAAPDALAPHAVGPEPAIRAELLAGDRLEPRDREVAGRLDVHDEVAAHSEIVDADAPQRPLGGEEVKPAGALPPLGPVRVPEPADARRRRRLHEAFALQERILQ